MILYFSGGSDIVETESDPDKAAVMLSYWAHANPKGLPKPGKPKKPNSRMRKILVLRRDAKRTGVKK